jgi:hypothetical protein
MITLKALKVFSSFSLFLLPSTIFLRLDQEWPRKNFLEQRKRHNVAFCADSEPFFPID